MKLKEDDPGILAPSGQPSSIQIINGQTEDWDICWFDLGISADTLQRLKPY